MKAIFFDLDGTLLHFTKDYDKVLKETFVETCGRYRKDWIKSYSENFFNYMNNFEQNPYRKAFEDVGTEVNPSLLVKRLMIKELDMCELPKNRIEKLNELSENYEIGVLSDGISDWQRNKLIHFDLLDCFDTIVISYDIGIHKPDKRIFNFAEENVSATDYLMIGDSEKHDIQGARSAGWNATLYQEQKFENIEAF